VKLEWSAPSVIGYAGYKTQQEAKNAISIARKSYARTYVSAQMYSGLPEMDRFTVKFYNLPLGTTKEDIAKYSRPTNVTLTEPNYMSVDDVGRCLQHRLQGSGLDILNFTILPPPYRDGLVRANIQFFSPAAARTATSYLNRQKPMCTGRIRIIARYEQTLSYSIPLDEYCWMREDL
ncbi:hypothetical protein F5880DRAFT_1453889, partial [Lentinula raphanica]